MLAALKNRVDIRGKLAFEWSVQHLTHLVMYCVTKIKTLILNIVFKTLDVILRKMNTFDTEFSE